MFSNEFMWHKFQKSHVEKRPGCEALQNGNKRADSFAAEACNENADAYTQRGHHREDANCAAQVDMLKDSTNSIAFEHC